MNNSESKYFNTARLMDEALLILLEKKEYEFITVKELCHKAGVNRSTFYLHYDSMDDVLQETVAMLNSRFYARFENDTEDSVEGKKGYYMTPDYLYPYFEFVKENVRTYRLAYANPKLFGADKTHRKRYEEVFEPILKSFGVAEGDRAYVFDFYYMGVVAVIKRWVADNCSKPIDEIVRLITGCVDKVRHEDEK